ncbi:TPA: hypothetical protein ACH3X2_002631 [Trebouxia sp. C0005]
MPLAAQFMHSFVHMWSQNRDQTCTQGLRSLITRVFSSCVCPPQLNSRAACSHADLRANALRPKVLLSVQAQTLAGQKMPGLSYDHNQERLHMQSDKAAKKCLHCTSLLNNCSSALHLLAADEALAATHKVYAVETAIGRGVFQQKWHI